MERAVFVNAMMKGLTIDVGKIIMREIRSSQSTKNERHVLGFPATIRQLYENEGVPLDNDEVDDIPYRKFLLFNFTLPPEAQQEQSAQAGSSAPPQHALLPPPPSSSMEARLAALELNIDNLDAKVTSGFDRIFEFLEAQYPPPE